jgi:putative transposase
MVAGVTELADLVGVTDACTTLGVPRSSSYRALQPTSTTLAARGGALVPSRRRPARRLSAGERGHIRDLRKSERFADCAPRPIWATLLDEQQSHCSWRTMYRILADAHEVRDRRTQIRRTGSSAPALLATQPNQLWSWAITPLRGPATWIYS